MTRRIKTDDQSNRAARHRNDGLRKLCRCPRRTWAKCSHPWHFNFKWAGEVYRFSLDRTIRRIVKIDGTWQRDRSSLGDVIVGKTGAERERDRLRSAIRDGSLLQPTGSDVPALSTLTLSQLMQNYRQGVRCGASSGHPAEH